MAILHCTLSAFEPWKHTDRRTERRNEREENARVLTRTCAQCSHSAKQGESKVKTRSTQMKAWRKPAHCQGVDRIAVLLHAGHALAEVALPKSESERQPRWRERVTYGNNVRAGGAGRMEARWTRGGWMDGGGGWMVEREAWSVETWRRGARRKEGAGRVCAGCRVQGAGCRECVEGGWWNRGGCRVEAG